MFDLADARLVWIPIRWKGVKEGEGGQAENCEHEIECQVELVNTERMKEIFTPTEDQEQLSEIEKFKALTRDWKGVKMQGQSAPMTDENIKLILTVPMFAAGFEKSYLDAWTGALETREKNSEGSPAPGRAEKASGAAKKTGK